jgi:hypothetical protein
MSIITLSYIALALFLGYAVAIALAMAATFGITAVSPDFVSKNNRIRKEYKFVQDGVWLVSAIAGPGQRRVSCRDGWNGVGGNPGCGVVEERVGDAAARARTPTRDECGIGGWGGPWVYDSPALERLK